MTRCIRIPLLIDAVFVDDARVIEALDGHPLVTRVVSGEGGLLHRALRGRIDALQPPGARLPAFRAREDEARGSAQAALRERLEERARKMSSDDEGIGALAAHVAGDGEVPGVSVQLLVGRLFRDDYVATKETLRAAKLLAAWVSANPLRALWWRLSGALSRARHRIWEACGHDTLAMHATSLAMPGLLAAVERMQALAILPGSAGLSADDAALRSLVAPERVLRAATGSFRLPGLEPSFRPGTLIVFELEKAHARSPGEQVVFAEGQWNECPARRFVLRLLARVWERAKSPRS